MTGQTVLHYKITAKLGEGGMGVVYKAEDTRLKREVAIKFLPRQIAASDEERARFKIEAQAAAALNHPNIATIHAIEEVDDEMFIVMEYIEGQELKSTIDGRQLSIDGIQDYAAQIAAGLQAAHEKGVFHRDIKSANIMITDKGVVKIMDFGLAKIGGGAQLTKGHSTLGTAAYMSPEQARGKEVDHRSDIWSFGVVLYEMITGKLPFPGDYEQAVIYSILNEEPAAVFPNKSGREDVPEVLQQIVSKALSKKLAGRYQSAADLVSDLNNLSNPSTVSAALPRKIRMRPSIFLGAGVLLLAIIAGMFFTKGFHAFDNSNIAALGRSTNHWQKSIAVLPFSDLSQARDQEYFCDGMTEQLITNLSHLQNLKVIARTSVITFKGSNKTVPEIGKALNVSHVLEGSIRKAGDRIRVTAQLIKVDDGTNLWGNDYDRELQDIFGVQDDVSQAIAEALFEQLSPKDVQAVKTQQSENVRAYEYNLKGRYFHYSRFLYYFKEEDFEKSEEMFSKAIKLDPNYGLAYAGLADLYDTYLRHRQENKRYAALRQEFAEKAFQLDPGSHFVNTINGWTHWGKGEYERAFASMKGALELNPNDSYGNVSMALLLDHFGLEHQAIPFGTRAVALDPLFATNYVTRGACYEAIRDFAQATRDYERGLEIEPEHMLSLNGLAKQYILIGRFNEAAPLLARCEKINPDYFLNKVTAAWLYAAKGEKEKALATHTDDIVYILLGMKDEAIRQLRKQHVQGWPLGIAGPRYGNYLSLKNLAIYDSLRDDSRFIDILEKEKQRYERLLRRFGEISQ